MGFAFRSYRFQILPNLWLLLFAAVLGATGFLAFSHNKNPEPRTLAMPKHFATCGYFTRDNCVVDGDTFVIDGQKIRIADIDAPELHSAKCSLEAELGKRASRRLRQLLNGAPVVIASYRNRDTDRYGRKLRIVMQNGSSIGDRMIAEGLARRWTGKRRSWCA